MPAMQRLEKQAQDAIERAQKLLESRPELNSVMLELNEAYGLLETALNPDNDSDPRVEFSYFIPQFYSMEDGEDFLGRSETFQEALAVLEQVHASAIDLKDGVHREYSIRCIPRPSF